MLWSESFYPFVPSYIGEPKIARDIDLVAWASMVVLGVIDTGE